MSRKTTVGIIGLGFGQRVLLPAFRSVDGVEVRAIAGSSLEKAREAANVNDIPCAYGCWQDLIDDPEVDGVAIAVPPGVQEEIAAAALNRNKHLFCEKPLGVDPDKTQRLATEANRRNLANMVDFEFSALPAWQAAKELVSAGGLGVLRVGNLNWQVESYASRHGISTWKARSTQGGGVLPNFASHMFYNLEWLCGPISEVFMACVPSLDETSVHGILRFSSGFVCSLCVSTESFMGSGLSVEIYGTEGSCRVLNKDFESGYTFTSCTRNGEIQNCSEVPSSASLSKKVDGRIPAVATLARRFIKWIQSGERATPDFVDGTRVDRVLRACRTSNASRTWIIV